MLPLSTNSACLVLGVPYDPALDIWSVGCTLYELYAGKILFPGRSNNQMLLLMMELKGRFNSKMIKKAKFGDVYFDDMGGFESIEKDRITDNVSQYISGVLPLETYIHTPGYCSEGSHLQGLTRPANAINAPSVIEDQRRRKQVNYILHRPS